MKYKNTYIRLKMNEKIVIWKCRAMSKGHPVPEQISFPSVVNAEKFFFQDSCGTSDPYIKFIVNQKEPNNR